MNKYKFTLPIVLVALLSCSIRNPSYTPEQLLYANYGTKIKLAVSLHQETMIAVGRAYKRGLMTDKQLDFARAVGKSVEVALIASRNALASTIEGKSSVNILIEAIQDLDNHLNALAAVASQLGAYGDNMGKTDRLEIK